VLCGDKRWLLPFFFFPVQKHKSLFFLILVCFCLFFLPSCFFLFWWWWCTYLPRRRPNNRSWATVDNSITIFFFCCRQWHKAILRTATRKVGGGALFSVSSSVIFSLVPLFFRSLNLLSKSLSLLTLLFFSFVFHPLQKMNSSVFHLLFLFFLYYPKIFSPISAPSCSSLSLGIYKEEKGKRWLLPLSSHVTGVWWSGG